MRRIRIRRPSAATAALLSAWFLFCAWIAVGWWASGSAQAVPYEVAARHDGYEVRSYGRTLAAQVSVAAPWTEAYRRGTALLAAYLEGANTTQESVALSRPVGMEPQGISLDGGFPVLTVQRGDAWLLSSLLPVRWTDVTAPRPDDPRVRIVRIPERTVAVLAFSGSATRDRVARQEERLRALLSRDGIATLGQATVAQYSPPWAPPFIRRNEVMLPVRQPGE